MLGHTTELKTVGDLVAWRPFFMLDADPLRVDLPLSHRLASLGWIS